MSRSAMEILRAGDPARVIEPASIAPDLTAVLAAAATDHGPVRGRHRRRWVASAGVAAAAVLAGVVAWPGQHDGPTSSAYGVTLRSDGLVDVRLPIDRSYQPAPLQARLRAAGVPAVVLMESPYGKCDEPPQDGIPSGKIILLPRLPRRDDTAFTIRPSAMPPGSTLVIILRIPGTGPGEQYNLGTTYVTDQKPPSCQPGTIFPPDPNPSARPS